MELREMTFAQMLHENAQKCGESTAIADGDYVISYRDLDCNSDVFAVRLLEMGVKPGDHVALRANNSIQWMTSFFGIIKAGAVAVLIDGDMKSLAMLDFLKLSDVRFILHSLSLASNSAKKLTKLLDVDESHASCIFRMNVSSADSDSLKKVGCIKDADDSHRTAVIAFSAGSTGTPKPVMLSQFSLLNAARIQCEQLKSLQSRMMCLAIPFFRSIGLGIALEYLCAGNMICLPASAAPADIVRILGDKSITAIAASARAYEDLIGYPRMTPGIAQKIHACYLDGGCTVPAQMMRMELAFGSAKFINGYSMTETGSYTTIPALSEPPDERAANVGKPLNLTRMAIFDDVKGILPDGQIGEILITGFNVMNGYYHVPKEKQPIDISGWFHTGDAGYINNGKLYYCGLCEDLIHRNGKVAAPVNIEKYIYSNVSIREAKVFGVPGDDGNDSIEACVVLKPDYLFDEETLRNELLQTLGADLMPSHFFVFESFPHTESGKLDHRALKNDMLNRVKAKKISQNLTNGILAAYLTIKNADYMIMPVVGLLESLARELGFTEAKIKRINHAAEEILTDRIMNAYGSRDGEITIEIILMSRGLRIFFRDRGKLYELADSEATTAKIVKNMVDNFVSLQDEEGYPCLSLDFLYDKEFDADAFLLEHENARPLVLE